MFLQHILIAFATIRQNLTRFVITSLIISIGIMALVGILTAIDGIKAGLTSQFSSMGANSFNIKNRGANIQFGPHGKRGRVYRSITYDEGIRFTENFRFPATVSLAINASWNGTIRFEDKKTNPNVQVMGSDENYLLTGGYHLSEGRNFSEREITNGADVALIGKEIRDKLFKSFSPVGQFVSVNGKRYKIIGVLAEKGSSMGFGGDRQVAIPINNARSRFPRAGSSCVITVAMRDIAQLEIGTEEARAKFRNIRHLRTRDDDNFEVLRSDAITQKLFENLSYVTTAAIFIAFITLLGAGIGLMNILLVSVTERTREIGTRKALGATKKDIRNQFLIEAIVICIMGGLGGIVLGILLGNLIGNAVGAGFIIPWDWISLGISVCAGVGLLSGSIPARKAARLAPIEALRHE